MNKTMILKESERLGKILSWSTLLIGIALMFVSLQAAGGFVLGMIFALITGKKHSDWIKQFD